MTETLRVDRRVPSLGRLHKASGTNDLRIFAIINRRIDDLIADRDYVTLRQIRDGAIALIELVRMHGLADRASRKARPKPRAQVVYIVLRRDTNEAKIGISRCLSKRLRALGASHAAPLEVLAVFGGGRRRELECHRLFADLHIRGEWFRADARLLAWARRADRRGLYLNASDRKSPTDSPGCAKNAPGAGSHNSLYHN